MSSDFIFSQFDGKVTREEEIDKPVNEIKFTRYVVSEENIRNIRTHIERAIYEFRAKTNARPKFLLLSKQAYGAFITHYKDTRNYFEQNSISIDYADEYDGMTVVCVPDQVDFVKVTAEPREAFGSSFQVTVDPRRQEIDQLKASVELNKRNLAQAKGELEQIMKYKRELEDDLFDSEEQLRNVRRDHNKFLLKLQRRNLVIMALAGISFISSIYLFFYNGGFN